MVLCDLVWSQSGPGLGPVPLGTVTSLVLMDSVESNPSEAHKPHRQIRHPVSHASEQEGQVSQTPPQSLADYLRFNRNFV